MPFLRVVRDKRGYETTYLMHWFQEAGKSRSRILYAFRGPGASRVGRGPLEPATMAAIATQFPDVSFDWKAVMADRQVIDSTPAEPRRRRPRREEPLAEGPPPAARPTVELQPEAPEPSVPDRQPAIPTSVLGETEAERLAFLAEWYPRLRERVERRTTDEARREALLLLAERLNPAGWADDANSESRLVQAGEALERLSRVLARRRRRGGKGRPTPPPATEP